MTRLCSQCKLFFTNNFFREELFQGLLEQIMAAKHGSKGSWRILQFVVFLSCLNNFASSQSQQYSTPILSPSQNLGSGYPQPQQNLGHGHLRPINGHSQQLSQDSPLSGSSSFAGSGYPPSRLPPGEGYGGQPHPGGGVPDYEVVDGPGTDHNHGNHGYNLPSKSKTVSGDYCWDPIFGCDTQNTILYCIVNRCTCPTGWTLSPGNLPLNTVWDPSSNRCLSLLGSGCHVSPSSIGNGHVQCQPGVQCIPHFNMREVGTCGGAAGKCTTVNAAILTLGLVLSRILFTNSVLNS